MPGAPSGWQGPIPQALAPQGRTAGSRARRAGLRTEARTRARSQTWRTQGKTIHRGGPAWAWWAEKFVQVDVSWIAQWSSRLLVDAARASLEACGTPSRRLQLGSSCFSWVVCPVAKHALALWRYVRGQGQWHEVAQLQWVGPAGREEWSAAYVQQEVRGRGEPREPHDLLVTDGVAVARIRHGTLRGRTNRHGFKLEGEGVFSASHRYFRNHVEAMDCRIHLCAQQPCGRPDEDCLHVSATAVIPSSTSIQEVAGRGPLARCATAAWFWGHAGAGAFTHLWKRVLKTGKFIAAGGRPEGGHRAEGRKLPLPGTTTRRRSQRENPTKSARQTRWPTLSKVRRSRWPWPPARIPRGARK